MEISCIVPVYNVEKYITKCINSILAQSFKDYEIIMIDDGSTDNSGNICDEYAQAYEFIRVIHQSNMGLSAARNAGIEIAKGKYFIFIDSDDYIDSNMFEKLYRLNKENDTLISVCDKAFVFENTGKIEYGSESREQYVLTAEQAFEKAVDFYGKFGMEMWNKLYSKKLFDDVRFPVGKLFEDQATQYKLIFATDRISYIEKSYYYYLRRSNSITTEGYSHCKEAQRMEMSNEMVNYISANHRKIIEPVLRYKLLGCNLTIVNKMIKANKCKEDVVFLKEVRKDIEYIYRILKSGDLSFVRHIQMKLIIDVFPVYKIIYKCIFGRKQY